MTIVRKSRSILVHRDSLSSVSSSSFLQIVLVFLITLVVLIFIITFIVFIHTEQLVLPLFARLAAVLSGVTASFLRKRNFVVVETESDGGVSMIEVSDCR